MFDLDSVQLFVGLCSALIPLVAFTLQCGRSRRLLHSPNAVRDSQASAGAVGIPSAPVPTQSKKGVLSRIFRRTKSNPNDPQKNLPTVLPAENEANVNADISKEELQVNTPQIQKPADANFWANIMQKKSERQKKKLVEEKATQDDTITAVDEESTKLSERLTSKRKRQSDRQKKSRHSELHNDSNPTDREKTKKTENKSDRSDEDKKSTIKSEYSNVEKKDRHVKEKKSHRKRRDSEEDSTQERRRRHKSNRRHRSKPVDEGSRHSRYADPQMRRRNAEPKQRSSGAGLKAPNYVQTFGAGEKARPRALPPLPQGGLSDQHRKPRPVAGANNVLPDRAIAAVN